MILFDSNLENIFYAPRVMVASLQAPQSQFHNLCAKFMQMGIKSLKLRQNCPREGLLLDEGSNL